MSKKQFFLFACLLLAIASCKNPDSIVGLNVQPPADKLSLSSTDTATLQTITLREDTLQSNNVLNLVGSCTSPIFGKTNCSVYAQVVFGNTPAFGPPIDILTSDSLILKLAYNSYYGDTTTTLTAHVYRLAQSMNVDSPYYNDQSFAYDTELAVFTFNPHPFTTLTEFGNTVVPELRIPLPKWLADDILSKNLQAELSTNDAWIQYFKGIYIKVDPVNTPGQGCICYFNMGSLDSKMTLYFSDNTTLNDSLFYDFQLSGSRSNYQTHDYTGTVVAAQLADSTVGNNVNYIQGAAGLKVKINMPYLKSFIKNNNLAINRAELIVKRVSTPSDMLPPPPTLWLQEVDSTGAEAYIPDQFEASPFYGGTYDSTNTQYVFNMTHYVQDVFNGKVVDHGLYLGVSGAAVLEYYGVVAANSVTIGSGQNIDPTQRMKLKLYYTKLH